MNCPTCNREMEHHEYQPADPEVGVREAPEEWVCGCGERVTNPTPSERRAMELEEAGHTKGICS
jgi:hypothetical protein